MSRSQRRKAIKRKRLAASQVRRGFSLGWVFDDAGRLIFITRRPRREKIDFKPRMPSFFVVRPPLYTPDDPRRFAVVQKIRSDHHRSLGRGLIFYAETILDDTLGVAESFVGADILGQICYEGPERFAHWYDSLQIALAREVLYAARTKSLDEAVKRSNLNEGALSLYMRRALAGQYQRHTDANTGSTEHKFVMAMESEIGKAILGRHR